MQDAITKERKTMVCPLCMSFLLDNFIRRRLLSPAKILKGFIEPGQRVMDLGCGPGFFTLDMARMVGPAGRVLAVDIQPGMLDKVMRKARRLGLDDRIDCRLSRTDGLGFQPQEKLDRVVAYYMIHETGSVAGFLRDIRDSLKPGGQALVVEPKMHVGQRLFEEMIREARQAGLTVESFPSGLGGRAVRFIR